MGNRTGLTNEIKKLHLEGVVLFAINNIPEADSATLKQFLELANADGAFGSISHEQILRKMNQVLRYIPGACMQSLLILVDLLEIEASDRVLLDTAGAKKSQMKPESGKVLPFAIEGSKAVASGNNGFYSG